MSDSDRLDGALSPGKDHLGGGVPRGVTLALFAVLVGSRLVAVVPSFSDLLSGPGGVDLRARRAELEWVVHGVDPRQALQRLVIERAQDADLETRSVGSAATADAEALPSLAEISVGVFSDGDFSDVNSALATYPHWSYPLYAALLWPPWPATTLFFAAILAVSMAGFCWWATKIFDGPWRWLAVLVCLIPMPSWSVAVFTGQFSIPLMLLLAGYCCALGKGRWSIAGVLIGFAAMKPTSSALFALALLSPVVSGKARWREAMKAGAVAATMIGTSSVLVWWRVGVDPWNALLGLRAGNAETAMQGYGLLPLMVRFGAFPAIATSVLALAGVALALSVPWCLRRRNLLCQFAIFGLLSRLWAYHRHYDDLLLVFLLLALLVEVRRGSLLAFGALLCMAMTLASPVPSSSLQEAWRVGVWILSAAVLLWEGRVERHQDASTFARSWLSAGKQHQTP